MILSYDETKEFIDFVLSVDRENAFRLLHAALSRRNRTEPEFYDGVIEHGPYMDYSSEEWFDFHQKIPHWRFHNERELMDKMTPAQRDRLYYGD